MEAFINFKTSDGKIFKVNPVILQYSKTIEGMLESCSASNKNEIIPLLSVSSAVFEKVLEWSKYHWDNRNNSINNNELFRKINFTLWENNFLRMSRSLLYELLAVAKFLNIEELSDLICKHLAGLIMGKEPEEMRDILNIPKDAENEE